MDQAGLVGVFQAVGRLGDVVGGGVNVERPVLLERWSCRSRPSTYSITR